MVCEIEMAEYEIRFVISLDENDIMELEKVTRKGARKPINKIVKAWKIRKFNQSNR